ncbi:MAG: nitroreductase/quinone reductase family protein [Anaerolineales bacterium]
MSGTWLFRWVLGLRSRRYVLTAGKAGGTLRWMPILPLTSVGRRTGRARTVPLMHLRDGKNSAVTASNRGMKSHPGWYWNLTAHPKVEIRVGAQTMEVLAETAGADANRPFWDRLILRAPFFDEYQKGPARRIPIVLLKPRTAAGRLGV